MTLKIVIERRQHGQYQPTQRQETFKPGDGIYQTKLLGGDIASETTPLEQWDILLNRHHRVQLPGVSTYTDNLILRQGHQAHISMSRGRRASLKVTE